MRSETKADRRASRNWSGPLGVLAVVVMAGLGAWYLSRTANRASDDSRPELAELVKAVGTYRPLETRLTGGFAYGSIQTPTRSGSGAQPLSPDVRIALARIEKRASVSNSDSDWAALGTSYLLSGELDKGSGFLEAAVAAPSPSPLWLSDLSAAYLSAALRDSRDELIPKALSVAEQACRVNARLREASFNRALALEALHLSEQATTAWKQYRTLDSDSAWSREALAHLTNLEQVRVQDSTRWDGVQRALEAGLEQSPDLERLRPARQQLRTWLETTLIPAWAERTLSGDRAEARQQLDHARAAADLLARLGGDLMPRDGILAIDDTERHDSNVSSSLDSLAPTLRCVMFFKTSTSRIQLRAARRSSAK